MVRRPTAHALLSLAISLALPTAPLPQAQAWQPAWDARIESPAQLSQMSRIRGPLGGNVATGWIPHAGVAFTQAGELLTFNVAKVPPKLAANGRPESAYRLNLTLRNARTGTRLATAERPTALAGGWTLAEVWPLTGGLLIRAGDTFYVTDNNLLQLRAFSMPATEPYSGPGPPVSVDSPDLYLSPSHSTAIILRAFVPRATVRGNTAYTGEPRVELCRLQGATMALQCTWANPFPNAELSAITDTQMLFRAGDTGGNYSVAAIAPHAVAAPVNLNGWYPQFTGPSTVIYQAPQPHDTFGATILQSRLDGKPRVLIAASKHDGAGYNFFLHRASISEDGSLAAFDLVKFRPPHWWQSWATPVSIRVTVMDLRTARPVATTAPFQPPKYDWDFSLSPHGRKLAILDDGVVSLYNVPRE